MLSELQRPSVGRIGSLPRFGQLLRGHVCPLPALSEITYVGDPRFLVRRSCDGDFRLGSSEMELGQSSTDNYHSCIELIRCCPAEPKTVNGLFGPAFSLDKLAQEYESLWNDMYSADAATQLRRLLEKTAELSKSSTGITYKKRKMLKWQIYVEQHHGAT